MSSLSAMEQLAILKRCFEEEILTEEEHRMKREQVLNDMMSGGGAKKPVSNPSRVVGRGPRADSPETKRKQDEADRGRYIQNKYTHVYEKASEGQARDKSPAMQYQPSGIDGVYYSDKAPEVLDVIEEKLPDRKEGPEHSFRVVKTVIMKELLDTGVVRVTRTEQVYDGYSGAYLTMNKFVKMKPKLYFHQNVMDDDEEFEMKAGTSKVASDDVKDWNKEFRKDEEEEYNRVMLGAVGDKQYKTKNVNNAAGKGDFGWDGVHRFPGGKPEEPQPKGKKKLFGKKKQPPKDPNDKWSGMDDNWDIPEEGEGKNGKGRKGKGKYSDGGRKGLFNVKKSDKTKDDKNMGEDVDSYKLKDPTKQSEGDREYMWDDGSGAGGFSTGEQWGKYFAWFFF